MGGNGGIGGIGGNVTVNNNAGGNIATLGDGANAIFAHSVGGGGGASGGGAGKANAQDLSVTVTLGGNAGSGGEAGTVSVTNNALLLTKGADADAIFAQSVGGGGGKAGKASSTTGGAQNAKQAFDTMSGTLAQGLNLDPTQVQNLGNNVYRIGDSIWKGISKISDLETVLGGSSVSQLRDARRPPIVPCITL